MRRNLTERAFVVVVAVAAILTMAACTSTSASTNPTAGGLVADAPSDLDASYTFVELAAAQCQPPTCSTGGILNVGTPRARLGDALDALAAATDQRAVTTTATLKALNDAGLAATECSWDDDTRPSCVGVTDRFLAAARGFLATKPLWTA